MTAAVSSLLMVIGLWISLAMFCCAGGRPLEGNKTAPQQSTPINVAAPRLIAEYEANEVSADRQYKDRTLIVTGKVDHVGKDIIDSMYVTLKSEQEFGITSVQCMFDDDWAIRLSHLREGDTVTVSGRCDGKLGNVLLRDCTFP